MSDSINNRVGYWWVAMSNKAIGCSGKLSDLSDGLLTLTYGDEVIVYNLRSPEIQNAKFTPKEAE